MQDFINLFCMTMLETDKSAWQVAALLLKTLAFLFGYGCIFFWLIL